ncbi:Type III flagellar switch regulator (C-ring) FliN C-term [Duganella sp. CF458]|uniref:FliM/FliN family flagellar motor C-terminal domain-containing protein n=1 Tax=Duganella sp. CF458 TaxID=1884368 RepID=UPI0008E39019|nr:FliM/FliN family flagellar motor C-terminal domain-containing protein [Duganella sp. CF458]SFG88858.1 Type III flagellar switch regulator (C-ring) FliN C-term [Duganella sp. CF458]
MLARPYILLSGTRLAQIERRLADALQRWQEQWGDAGLHVACTAAGRADAAGFAARAAWQGSGQAWMAWHDEFGAAVERGLFGGVAAGLAHTLAARAQQALLAGLAEAAMPGALRQGEPGAVAPANWQPGAGAVLARVHCGRHTLQLLLEREAVAALAPAAPLRPPALAPCRLPGLAGSASVALPVRLGAVQLDLAALMSVQVGDVIRLDAAADQPLPVLAPDGGQPLFYGHLGRAGKLLALEVGPFLPSGSSQ